MSTVKMDVGTKEWNEMKRKGWELPKMRRGEKGQYDCHCVTFVQLLSVCLSVCLPLKWLKIKGTAAVAVTVCPSHSDRCLCVFEWGSAYASSLVVGLFFFFIFFFLLILFFTGGHCCNDKDNWPIWSRHSSWTTACQLSNKRSAAKLM